MGDGNCRNRSDYGGGSCNTWGPGERGSELLVHAQLKIMTLGIIVAHVTNVSINPSIGISD